VQSQAGFVLREEADALSEAGDDRLNGRFDDPFQSVWEGSDLGLVFF